MEELDAALQFISVNVWGLLVGLSGIIVFGSLFLFAAYFAETRIAPRYFPEVLSHSIFKNRLLRTFVNQLYRSYRYNMRMTILFTGAAYLILAVFLLGLLGHFALRNADKPWCLPFFLSSGIILYGLRSRFAFIYGALELSVGLSSIWYSTEITSSVNSDLARLLTISSGVYITVRGLDNMSRDLPLKLRPYWPILKWEKPLRSLRSERSEP